MLQKPKKDNMIKTNLCSNKNQSPPYQTSHISNIVLIM